MHPPPRLVLSALFILLLSFIRLVLANTEKTIFLGPPPATIPLAPPSLANLHLHTITSEDSSVRTNLTRVFPSEPRNARLGHASWLLLDDLAEGQRYELRVCWAAIEPTSFALDVYELDTVWETPELIQSLATYAATCQPEPLSDDQAPKNHITGGQRTASVLLLQVWAAADYFTDNQALMKDPPPVLVDLILDPYFLNAVPRSLLPTTGYLAVVALITWFVARRIVSTLQSIAGTDDARDKKQL